MATNPAALLKPLPALVNVDASSTQPLLALRLPSPLDLSSSTNPLIALRCPSALDGLARGRGTQWRMASHPVSAAAADNLFVVATEVVAGHGQKARGLVLAQALGVQHGLVRGQTSCFDGKVYLADVQSPQGRR